MCAIAGIFGMETDDTTLSNMLETMRRRGPDASGMNFVHGGWLLHARLVVIDPEGGRQPMTLNWDNEEYTIVYNGELYLFHAPIDREHIGVIKINREDISKSEVVLQAKMQSSCFYPFVQYYRNGGLAMSYTVARQHIRLAEFDLSKYI